MSDDLFRLGWLNEPKLASRCLTILREKADRYKRQGVQELDTQAIFVEPLLRGLGWDTLDHDQVDREYPRGGPVVADIHLMGAGKVAAVIEVKILHAPDLAKAYDQLRRNVFERLFSGQDPHNQEVRLELDGMPFVRGVVTNGVSWNVYDFNPGVAELAPAQHTRVCEFDLRDNPDPGRFIQVLGRSQLLNLLRLSVG
jgi:predicted type IV restriction endonuclease